MIGQLSEIQIHQLLRRNVVGRIGYTDGDQIYVVPVYYVFEDQTILCNSQAGMKIEWMRKYPNVCFEVDEMKKLTEWQSVIIQGRYLEIEGEKEKQDAAFAFLTHLLLHQQNEATSLAESPAQELPSRAAKARAVYYRIVIEAITGRFESP